MTAVTQYVDKDQLGQLTQLGDGGQGRVYRCSATALLYKEYHSPGQVNVHQLVGLLQSLDAMPDEDRRAVNALSAFPLHLVSSAGSFSGFLMSPAREGFFGQIGSARKLQELQYLTHPKRPVWDNLAIPDASWKLRFLVTCARLFDVLHRNSLVVGDVSMRNILWSASEQPSAFLIDCDSMRLLGEPPAVPAAVTPDWDDPDAVADGGFDSDRYKLALIVLRVLSVVPNARPSAPGSLLDTPPFTPLLRKLMDAATVAGQRPPAARWIEALENRGRIQLAPTAPPAQRNGRIKPAARPTIVYPGSGGSR